MKCYFFRKQSQFSLCKTKSCCINKIKVGVPQGSVLGVLFFLIYINDLPNSTLLHSSMYADDSTFLNSSNSVSVLESSTVNEMKKVIEWFHTNKMAVNIDKSNVMVFSPCLQPSPRVSITIENSNGIPVQISQIPNTDENSFKLLGFHIDERLTLRKQVDNICSKVNKSLFFLSRVKRTLPLYCRKQLYFSHVHSHFVYCLSLLSIANKTDIIKLERIQRKALRIVYNASFRADTKPFFHDLYTLSICI